MVGICVRLSSLSSASELTLTHSRTITRKLGIILGPSFNLIFNSADTKRGRGVLRTKLRTRCSSQALQLLYSSADSEPMELYR